jgi:hypothetical protein
MLGWAPQPDAQKGTDMKALFSTAILFSITTQVAQGFPAEPQIQTQAFEEVRQTIDRAVATFGAENVLVVFDTDNTILATDQDIASEHWFMWQADMIKAGDFAHGAVARTIEDALRLQGYVLNVSAMHPVEPRIGADVRELTEAGVRFMVLTSRMLDVRDPTAREYERAGIDLATNAIGPRNGYAGTFMPYDPARPEEFGLTAEDVERFKLHEPKPVIYENGIFLTQGQHKGSMLKTMLAKTGVEVKAVVFVDDRAHHLEGMQQAFEKRPEAIYTVQYQHELERIEAFRASDKAEVIAQWCAFAAGLAAVSNAETCAQN